MIFALLLVLGQSSPVIVTDPTYQNQKVTTTSAGAKRGLDVNCVSGCAAGTGAPTLVYILDAGPPINVNPIVVSGAISVNILDAGPPLNVNFPATQAVTQSTSPWVVSGSVSVTSIPTVNIADAGPPLNVNPVAIASLPLVFIQDAGVLNTNTNVTNFPATQAVTQSTSPWVVSGTVAVSSVPVLFIQDAGVLNVNFPATQAVTQSTSPWVVSGTVTTTPPSNASTNVAQFGGSNVATGTGAGGAGVPRVTVSNDSNILATQSGSWTVTSNQGGAPWTTTPPTGSANNTGACVSVTTNTTVLATNGSRRQAAACARLSNTDTTFLKLGATATTSNFPLEPGQCLNLTAPGSIYTGQIDAIANSGTQSVCVVEVN